LMKHKTGIIAVETDNGNTPTPLQPIYVEDGSNLIEVYIENPVTGLIEPVYR